MKIGIPFEVKPAERRVALTPQACGELVAEHEVFIEKDAGLAAGFPDELYAAVGVTVLSDADALYDSAELIVKVKEPLESDLNRLRPEHTLFCYLHLAGVADLAEELQKIGLTAYAFETVVVDGKTPLLAPMSAIAGRLAVQLGARFLHNQCGGRGVLLGGISGHDAGNLLVIGGGIAGTEAALLASGMGAQVTMLDVNPDRVAELNAAYSQFTSEVSKPERLEELLQQTDLLIGAVYVIGKRAPIVCDRDQIRLLPNRAVAVDIAIDQGGCFATSCPTTHADPTFLARGVIHSCITNLPAAVPNTASDALSTAILPYVKQLADGDLSPELTSALNVQGGQLKIDL